MHEAISYCIDHGGFLGLQLSCTALRATGRQREEWGALSLSPRAELNQFCYIYLDLASYGSRSREGGHWLDL